MKKSFDAFASNDFILIPNDISYFMFALSYDYIGLDEFSQFLSNQVQTRKFLRIILTKAYRLALSI